MTWTVETFAVIVPIVVVALGAIGYLGRRWLTGQAVIEDQESVERAVKLQKLLDEEGLSLDEARALRDKFRASRGGFTQAEADTIAAKLAEAEERENETLGSFESGQIAFEDTTIGMQIKATAELEILDASLEHVVNQLRSNCSESHLQSLEKAQQAWSRYRDANADLASFLAEGGTLAPLLFTVNQIDLTEQRIKEIRLMLADTNL